jgi:hypothetical protein
MASWSGHKPVTSAAMLALLSRASTGAGNFSYAERVLFVACEFWAAAMNRTLAHHLTDHAHSKLYQAEDAFRTIGLAGVEKILRLAYVEFTTASPPKSLAQIAAHLEDKLAHLDEPVDDAIEVFARRWLFSR